MIRFHQLNFFKSAKAIKMAENKIAINKSFHENFCPVFPLIKKYEMRIDAKKAPKPNIYLKKLLSSRKA
jgi:hypothetical protein